MEPSPGESKEVHTVLGWILDYAVRHECAELVQVLPKTGHQPATIGALALRQLKTSFEELASNPSPCFEEWQVSSFEEALKSVSESAPESAQKWLLELKERVVLCLHAENKLRAARETLAAFFPERPVLLNSILHDKRAPVGSTQFNQAYISRKVSSKSLKGLAQDLSDFMADWLNNLPPCLLDQLVEVDFTKLADPEIQEPRTSSLEEHKEVVPPAAVMKPDKQMEAEDEETEEEEATSRGKPTRAVTRKKSVQQEKRPLKVTRKSSRRCNPVPDEPASDEPSEDEEVPEVPEVVKLRSKSALLLKRGGEDPLVQARKGSPMPESIKPAIKRTRSNKSKASIVLEKCVEQPEWASDGEEEADEDDQASSLPKLGEAPAHVKFKPLKPLSEIGNQTATQSKPVRKGRKRVRWTPTEEEQLRKGVEKCGEGNWADVLEQYKFNCIRTSVDLKDKWRNMNK